MRRITVQGRKHQKWAGCWKEIERSMGAADWIIAGYGLAMGTLLMILILTGRF